MKSEVRKIDYTGQEIYCGLDVHKKRWQITVCTKHTIQKPVSIERPFVQNLKRHLEKKYPGGIYHVAYEAGFSGFGAHKAMEENGMKSMVVHAADIPTTDKDRKQKNDKRDSRKIAISLRSGELVGIYVPSDIALQDRSIVRERWSLARSERRVKNQIKSHLMFFGVDVPDDLENRYWSRRFIKWLQQIRKERDDRALGLKLERLMLIRQNMLNAVQALRKLSTEERHQKSYRILRSVPGIGLLTAMLLIVELIDIRRFPRFDELCSYTEFIPTTRSTGEKETMGELTNRKNQRIMPALVQSSWVSIKSDPELLMKYENYRKKMGGQKAIIKIARILLRRIQVIWSKEILYQKAEC